MAQETAPREWECVSVPTGWDDSTPPTYEMTCTESAYPVVNVTAAPPMDPSAAQLVTVEPDQFWLVIFGFGFVLFLMTWALVYSWRR